MIFNEAAETLPSLSEGATTLIQPNVPSGLPRKLLHSDFLYVNEAVCILTLIENLPEKVLVKALLTWRTLHTPLESPSRDLQCKSPCRQASKVPTMRLAFLSHFHRGARAYEAA